MTKTLIVHGLDGSPDPHWQHWWAMTDSTAIVVNLPNPSRPSPVAWKVELASVILRHPDSILVGHSLGAVLIHWANVGSNALQCGQLYQKNSISSTLPLPASVATGRSSGK